MNTDVPSPHGPCKPNVHILFFVRSLASSSLTFEVFNLLTTLVILTLVNTNTGITRNCSLIMQRRAQFAVAMVIFLTAFTIAVAIVSRHSQRHRSGGY